MVLFDYLFYRFATWFYREDGSFGTRAMLAVSLMQFALLLPWFLFIICWAIGTPRAQRHQDPIFGAVILLLLLCAWGNYRRYRNRFDALSMRWKHEKYATTLLKTLASVTAFLASFYLAYKIGCALPF